MLCATGERESYSAESPPHTHTHTTVRSLKASAAVRESATATAKSCVCADLAVVVVVVACEEEEEEEECVLAMAAVDGAAAGRSLGLPYYGEREERRGGFIHLCFIHSSVRFYMDWKCGDLRR